VDEIDILYGQSSEAKTLVTPRSLDVEIWLASFQAVTQFGISYYRSLEERDGLCCFGRFS